MKKISILTSALLFLLGSNLYTNDQDAAEKHESVVTNTAVEEQTSSEDQVVCNEDKKDQN